MYLTRSLSKETQSAIPCFMGAVPVHCQQPVLEAGDVIDISRNILLNVNSRVLCTCYEEKPLCPVGKTESPLLHPPLVEDKTRCVFAAIAGAFGSQQVSLRSVIQKRKVDNNAEIVLITYRVSDEKIRMAMNTLEGMPFVTKVRSIIRVEADDIA